MRVSPEICVRCKGYRRLCGLKECPLLLEQRARSKILEMLESSLSLEGATPPSFVLGEKGYPRLSLFLNIAPVTKREGAREYDNPIGWWGKRDLHEIVELRSSLFSAKLRVDALDPWYLYTREYGLASISYRPVGMEAQLARRPVPLIKFDPILKPLGLSSPVKRVVVEDEPRLTRLAEKLIWDDAPSYTLIKEAYMKGMDVYDIVKMFSLGFIGRIKRRRMVPTRWSITAVDDIVSHFLRQEIIHNDYIDEPMVFETEYLSNSFKILLFPGSYEALFIEAWHPLSLWNRWGDRPYISIVREDWRGRMVPRDGGFSAARLPVLELLYRMRKQARVLILREIKPQYIVPVGNWHIRESVRNALRKKPLTPGKEEEILQTILKGVEHPIIQEGFRKAYTRFLSQKRIEEYLEA